MSLSEQEDRRKRSRRDSAVPKWSSGRRLTDSQRARKREVDRVRTRQHRQSMLTRIAELEAKLQCVLAGKSDNSLGQGKQLEEWNELPNSARNRISNDTEVQENDAASLRSFGRDPKGQPYADITELGSLSEHSTDMSQVTRCWRGEYQFPSQSSRDDPQDELTIYLNNSSDLRDTLSTVATASSLQLSGDVGIGSGSIPILWITNALKSSTQMLKRAQQFHQAEICLDDRTNQDALIRAITKGWDVVEARGKLCPLWTILHSIDSLIFWRTSHITRLVMLRMIHHMLLFKVCGKTLDELPPWYRPRPTQRMFPHDELADFFAWPGMRERLVLLKESLLTNEFWECFTRDFRFHWPYPFQEIYDMDLSTDRFYFSTLFESQLEELSMWQMERQFFMSFPEFGDDITAAKLHCSESSIGPRAIQRSLQQGELYERTADIGSGQVQDFDSALVHSEIPGHVYCELATFDGSNYDSLASSLSMDMFDNYFSAL